MTPCLQSDNSKRNKSYRCTAYRCMADVPLLSLLLPLPCCTCFKLHPIIPFALVLLFEEKVCSPVLLMWLEVRKQGLNLELSIRI